MKRFEYSLLGKKLKAQTDIANKQHQKLDNTFEFDKRIKKEKPTLKNIIGQMSSIAVNTGFMNIITLI